MHDMQALTLSVPEAGRLLGIGRDAAYRAARNGAIPTIRVGGRVLVPKHQFARLLDGEPPAPPTSLSRALIQ